MQQSVQVCFYNAEWQNQHGCGFALTQRMTPSWKAGAQIGLILIISLHQPAYRRPEQIWWMDQSAQVWTADTYDCMWVYTHHGLHNYYSSRAHIGLEKSRPDLQETGNAHSGRVFVLHASRAHRFVHLLQCSLGARRASLAHFASAHISGASERVSERNFN